MKDPASERLAQEDRVCFSRNMHVPALRMVCKGFEASKSMLTSRGYEVTQDATKIH